MQTGVKKCIFIGVEPSVDILPQVSMSHTMGTNTQALMSYVQDTHTQLDMNVPTRDTQLRNECPLTDRTITASYMCPTNQDCRTHIPITDVKGRNVRQEWMSLFKTKQK